MSIHHLSAVDKANMYSNCYKWLNKDGIFISADQVLGSSTFIEPKFLIVWRNTVENSGLSHDEIQKAYERVSFDNPSTLSVQLHWLKEAGFQHTDIICKYYHLCVFYTKK